VVSNLSFYSSSYPAFLRSQGPYQIYNHHKLRGDPQTSKRTKADAKKRLEEQLQQLRERKEREKAEFLL